MEWLGGLIVLYIGYFILVRSLPYLFEALVWLLEKAIDGFIALASWLLDILLDFGEWARKHLRFALVRLWHGFHSLRLGEARFQYRFIRKFDYGYVIGLIRQRHITENPRFYNRWRWSLWETYMEGLGFFYAKAYDDVLREEEERKREEHEEEKRKKRISGLLKKLVEEEAREREKEVREREEEEHAMQRREERHRQMAKDPVGHASGVLGLDQEFSRADFKRAYRSAMMEAESDPHQGHERLLVVLEAADVIRKHKGWFT